MGKSAVSSVADAMRLGGRSATYLWMWDHYDELAAAAAVGRVSWVVVARRFAEAGVSAGEGCTPDALRMTWRRVVARKARVAQRPVGARVSARPEISKPGGVPGPVGEATPEADDGFEFHDVSGRKF